MTSSVFDPASDELIIAKPRKEIVFIESDIADIGSLINGIGRGKEVVILDATQDGLHQIAQALAGRSGIDAVHIMSHGEAGAVHLGSLILNSANLDAYKDDLQTIRQGMSADGDILLYGCRIGADGDAGFVQQLAIATGADVAASSDVTGAAAFGGNWNLEVVSGQVDTAVAIDAQAMALYQGVLGLPPGVYNFSNTGNFLSGLNPADSNVKRAASTDVIYRLNGDSAYQLKIDGANHGVFAYTYVPAGQIFAGLPDAEGAVTISFVNGQIFTLNSISIANYNNFNYASENLIIKGYDASGNLVGGAVTPPSIAYGSVATPISLSNIGSTPIKTLKIMAADGALNYIMIDSISISSVAPPPPNAPSAPDLSAGSDSGSSNTDNITSQKTGLIFTGTTEAGVTAVKLYDTDGTTEIASTSSITGTNYTITTTGTLADGAHTVKVKAFNAGGAASAASGNLSLTVDSAAPNAPSAPDLSTGSDSGSSTTDNITSQKTGLIFTGTTEAGVTLVKLYDTDGVTEIASTSTISGTTYTITTTATLADGAHAVKVKAFDAAGNASAASSNLNVTVDTQAPTVSITSNPSSLKFGETAAITFTFSDDPGASFTAADVSVSGGTLSAITGTGASRGATFTPTANTNGGSASISVSAGSFADAAGNANTASAASPAITFDTLVPNAPTTPDLTSDSGSSSTDNLTNIKTGLAFTGTTEAGVTSVKLYDTDGTEIASTSTISGTTYTITTTGTLADGVHTLKVKALDAVGNASAASGNLSITVDTVAPTASITVDATSTLKAGDSAHYTFHFSEDPGASFTLSDIDYSGGPPSNVTGTGLDREVLYVPPANAGGTASISVAANRYSDAAGNFNTASSSSPSITYDTLAPNAPSTPNLSAASDNGSSNTDNITNINTGLVFTGSTDPGVTSVKLYDTDEVTEIAGTSSISGTSYTFTTTGTLASGSHLVTAKAFDAAGNASPTFGSLNLTIDMTAPAAPSAPDLDAGSDSGSSNTDDLTATPNLTFRGTAGTSASVKLYDSDGTTQIGSGTADGAGKWVITTVSPLSNGTHTITARTVDVAGNASSASPGLAVTVDRTPPSTTVSSAQLSADTGASSSDMITSSSGTQVISGVLSANLAAGEQVMVSIDNGATWAPAVAAVGANTWELTTSLSASNVLKVQVLDQAGNGGAVYAHAYVIDTSAPAAPSAPDLDAASDSGSSDTDNITSLTLPSFSGTAEVGSTVRLFDGGIEIGSDVAEDGNWHITTSSATPMGQRTHYITAIATDLAGNSSTNSTPLEVVVLTGGPATTVASMALSVDSGTAGDFITNQLIQNVSGTLSSVLGAGERVEVSGNGGTSWSPAISAAGSNAWSITAVLASGTHDIKVRVVDAVDNPGPVFTQAYTVDSIKPTVSVTSSASTLKAGDTATITFTFSEDPGASFTAADTTVSGGTLSALSGTGTTRTAVFTPDAGLNGGTASIAVNADSYADLAGNLGTAGAAPSITFDTLAPGAASAPDLDKDSDTGVSDTDNLTNLSSLVFKGTAEAGATVKLYDSNGTTEIGSGTASGGSWTIATSALGAGSHTVTAKVTDAAGNVSAVSAATTVVVDTAKPTVSIGSDVSQLKAGDTAAITFTFSEDPGASFTAADITVSGGTLSALSGTGAVRTATFTPAANTNGGTAGISVSAGAYQDAAGNDGTAGATPSLHFDTLAPGAPSTPALLFDNGISHIDGVINLPDPVFTGTAEAGATVTLVDAGTGEVLGSATTAIGGTWTILSKDLSEGTHQVYATTRDAAGNPGPASANATVTYDKTPPTVTVTSNVSTLKIGETALITLVFSEDPGAAFSIANLASGGAGTFSDLAGTGLTRTVLFTPAPDHELSLVMVGTGVLSDMAGNTSLGGTVPITIDTRAPSAPSVLLAVASDTGSSPTDRLTNQATPSFRGVKELTATVTLYDSDGTVIGTSSDNSAAWTIASSALADGVHTITARQTDSLGNVSTLSAGLDITVDTHVAAPASPVLHPASDSGAAGDGLTSDTTPTITGSAEANATVTLYDSDGSTVLGAATADAGGAWSITSSALAAGVHDLSVRQVDAAGNASAASPVLSLRVDDVALALPAPTLAVVSDSGVLGDAISKVAAPIFSGSAEALAQVTLYDGTTAIGSVKAGADGAWKITASTLPDGVHAISARQVDLAGNESGAGTVFSLTVDTVAPAAPAAPLLKASSDTGTIGDGITLNNLPVIEGAALANTLVTLYDSAGASRVKVGTALSDGAGKWSIATTGMSIGTHILSATQSDAAGNESAASAGFTLRIDEPLQPVNLIDGMPVTVQPISLPGGVNGSAVSIPLVGAGRSESSGQAGVADIPLVTSGQGATVLLAQLGVGYGLSASGASLPVANGAELLLASIKAATPAHAAADQGHLTGNGQSFLAGLGATGSLLVETVKPVSSAAPEGLLTLTGQAPGAGQSTALVIDAGSLAAGATLALQQVNFAAVIGAANVVALSSMVLSGDAASQHFTVAAGGSGSVFAGGGNDVLSVAAIPAAGPAPAAGTTLLHGGAASDAATFSGARADYNIEVHNGYVIVSSKSAPALKAMVVNVEQLQFSDASVAVQNSADMGTLAGMYQTVLGRQADVMGIEYWANVHQAGASWGAIALSMIASSEHVASHDGFNGVAAHDIALLYTAIFNRDADAGGLAYWSAAMGRGLSLEQVASSFVQSAEMVGHQRATTDWDFIVV